MEPPVDANQYTVKEILTQFVMPALDDLRATARLQEEANEQRFSSLEAWRNKTLGALAILTVIVTAFHVPISSAMGL